MAVRWLNRQVRRWLKRLTVVALTVVTLLVALQIFGKPIAERLLTDIFTVPVTAGAVTFDHRSGFPETGIVVKNLRVHSSDSLFDKDIFQIKRATVSLNIWKVLYQRFVKKEQGQLQISYIRADCVKVFLAENFVGKRNFDGLFKGRPGGPKRPPPALIELKEITLSRTVFRYFSEGKFKDYAFRLDTVRANIKVKRTQIEIFGQPVGSTDYLQIRKLRILDDFPLKAHVKMTYMKESKKIFFLPSTTVSVGNSTLELQGKMTAGPVPFYDLRFNTRKGSVQTLMGLLPAGTRNRLAKYDLSGILVLNGSMIGSQSDSTEPHFELGFRCTDAAFQNLKTRAQVNRTSLSGVYSNGKLNSVASTFFSLDTVQGYLGERPFYSSFRLSDFQDPKIDLELKSGFRFADMMNLVGLAVNDSASGEAFVDLSAHGRLRHLSAETNPNNRSDSLKFRGTVELKDISMATDSFPVEVENVNGKISVKDTDLKIEHLNGAFNGDPLQCALSVQNIVPFLLTPKGTAPPKVFVEAEAALASLNLDRFIDTWVNFRPPAPQTEKQIFRRQLKTEKKEIRKASRTERSLLPELPKEFEGKVRLIIHDLNYKGLNFDLVRAETELKDRKITLNQFKIHSPEHQLNFSGSWDASDPAKHRFPALRAECSSQNLSALVEALAGKPKKTAPDSEDRHTVRFIAEMNADWEKKAARPGTSADFKGKIKIYNGHYEILSKKKKPSVREIETVIHLHEQMVYDPMNAQIIIDSIFAVIEPRYRVRGKIKLESPKTQNVEAELESALAASVLWSLLAPEGINNPAGTVDFKAKVWGKVPQLVDPDSFSKIKTEGHIFMRQIGFDVAESQIPVREVNADVIFNANQDIELRYLNGRLAQTRIQGQGLMQNLVGRMFGKEEELQASMVIKADSMDLQTFLTARNEKNGEKKHDKQTSPNFRADLPDRMNLTLRAELGKLTYDRLKFENMELGAHLQNKLLALDRMEFQTCGGRITANGLADADAPDSLGLFAHLNVREVNVKELLHGLHDFKQNFITEENLSGRLNAQILVADRLPKNFMNFSRNLEVALRFTLTDGNLSRADYLTEKLKYIYNKKYLQNIPFVMQGGNIRLYNSRLYFSDIELKSHLLDISLQNGSFNQGQTFYGKLSIIRVGRKEREIVPDLLTDHKNDYDESLWVFDLQTEGKNAAPRIRWDFLTARRNIVRKFMRKWLGEKK